MLTIHQLAQENSYMNRQPNLAPSCPSWVADRIRRTMYHANLRRRAKAALARHDYLARYSTVSRRPAKSDFGWRAALAKAIHSEMGYRDADLRKICYVLAHIGSQWNGWDRMQPDSQLLATLPPCRTDTDATPGFKRGQYPGLAGDPDHVRRWRAWIASRRAEIIGEYFAREILRKIAQDSNYVISGYLAASILSWRAGKYGYEGCSGSEHIAWFQAHDQYWDLLLNRAPVGASGPGWEQVYPHELERAKACQARGWFHTLRLSDSIWSERHPILNRTAEQL